MKDHSLVDPIQKLRAEVVFQFAPNGVFHVFIRLADHGLDHLRANVGSHDDHRVFEVHGAALAIGQAAIVQHLQQHVEDIGVGFLYLVEQQHRIRFAAHRLGQITALFVTHIARWRANQTGHRMLFHELAHIDANQMVFAVKQEAGQRFAQLGLAHAGGAQEQKRTGWTVRVRQARA